MSRRRRSQDRRTLLDAKLAELSLLAKELCPSATVEANTIRYEDEDGRVAVFASPDIPEAEVDRIELALNDRAAAIYKATGLFLLCAVFDRPPL